MARQPSKTTKLINDMVNYNLYEKDNAGIREFVHGRKSAIDMAVREYNVNINFSKGGSLTKPPKAQKKPGNKKK